MPKKCPTKPDSKVRGPKGVPLDMILYLVDDKGMSMSEAGRALNLHRQTVSERLKKAGYITNHSKLRDESRAFRLLWAADKIINSLDDQAIKKIPPQSRMLCASQAIDKARLLMGMSTSNVAVNVWTAQLEGSEQSRRSKRGRPALAGKVPRGTSDSNSDSDDSPHSDSDDNSVQPPQVIDIVDDRL